MALSRDVPVRLGGDFRTQRKVAPRLPLTLTGRAPAEGPVPVREGGNAERLGKSRRGDPLEGRPGAEWS
jgi:hypothetical protein